MYHYNEHTIGKYRLGVVVQDILWTKMRPIPTKPDCKIGHVIGLSLSCMKEAVLDVKWCDGTTSSIHPANVKILGE